MVALLQLNCVEFGDAGGQAHKCNQLLLLLVSCMQSQALSRHFQGVSIKNGLPTCHLSECMVTNYTNWTLGLVVKDIAYRREYKTDTGEDVSGSCWHRCSHRWPLWLASSMWEYACRSDHTGHWLPFFAAGTPWHPSAQTSAPTQRTVNPGLCIQHWLNM